MISEDRLNAQVGVQSACSILPHVTSVTHAAFDRLGFSADVADERVTFDVSHGLSVTRYRPQVECINVTRYSVGWMVVESR